MADDPITDLKARFEAQAQATAAELQELRAALRAVAQPDEARVEAYRAKTVLKRDNAELKSKLATLEHENAELTAKYTALNSKHGELETLLEEHLRDVQHASSTLAAKFNRLRAAKNDDNAPQAIAPVPKRRVVDPPVVCEPASQVPLAEPVAKNLAEEPAAVKRTSKSPTEEPAAAKPEGPMPKHTSESSMAKRAAAKRPRCVYESEDSEQEVPHSSNVTPSVPLSDVARLEAGMDLTPALVDHFLNDLRGRTDICDVTKQVCRILPASVLSSLMGSGTPPPLPAAYKGLLGAEIVVLPLYFDNHWSVTVVFGLHDAANSPATIVAFDPMDGRHDEVAVRAHVRAFLVKVHQVHMPGARSKLALREDFLKVRWQTNPNDSGIWMLLNVSLALCACTKTRAFHPTSRYATNFHNVSLGHWLRDGVQTTSDAMVHAKRQEMIETLRL